MKEFIEKLIGRLKERENHYRCEVEKVKRFSKIRICRELQMRAYKTSIKIVNELAEEYGKDTNVTTNADRIRSMNDEELAEFLCKVKADYQWITQDFPREDECDEWVIWLQSEVEGVTENE